MAQFGTAIRGASVGVTCTIHAGIGWAACTCIHMPSGHAGVSSPMTVMLSMTRIKRYWRTPCKWAKTIGQLHMGTASNVR